MRTRREVILLTSKNCAFCDDAKEILERLRTEFQFDLVELEHDSPRGRQLAREGRLLFPPGIVIDGEPFGFGRPSERKLRRRLEALQSGAPA
jgi:glutaredoxin